MNLESSLLILVCPSHVWFWSEKQNIEYSSRVLQVFRTQNWSWKSIYPLRRNSRTISWSRQVVIRRLERERRQEEEHPQGKDRLSIKWLPHSNPPCFSSQPSLPLIMKRSYDAFHSISNGLSLSSRPAMGCLVTSSSSSTKPDSAWSLHAVCRLCDFPQETCLVPMRHTWYMT